MSAFIVHHSAFLIDFGPVAQRNQSATLRRSRSHVQIVPGPPSDKDEVGGMKDELRVRLAFHPSAFILAVWRRRQDLNLHTQCAAI